MTPPTGAPAPGTMPQTIILSANGEHRSRKVDAIPTSGQQVAKLLRRTKAAELIGTYTWKDTTLTLWGWSEGKAGTENKHELPPPHDEILLFGDVMVTRSAGDLTEAEWDAFYDAAFGGFESIGTDDEDADADADADVDVEDDEPEADEEDDGDESDVDEVEAEDEEAEAEAEAEEEEEDGGDDDCFDDGDDGGGSGKRRAPRRRTACAPEFRRIDMGLRSRIKIPTPPGKRAPRWQTAPELVPEAYD